MIAVYHGDIKNHQVAGACIQNMLLDIEIHRLGAVWLDQILKNKLEVNRILVLGEHYDLIAVLAIDHPEYHNQKKVLKEFEELILKTL